jgi:hypothetical protein
MITDEQDGALPVPLAVAVAAEEKSGQLGATS